MALESGGRLAPGEDFVEPLALVATFILINVGSWLGFFVEAAAFCLDGYSERFGPFLLAVGTALTCLLISIPAVHLLWIRLI